MKWAYVLSVAMATAALPAVADGFPNGVTPDGVGPIKIGMPVEKLELVLHDKLGYNQYANRGCSQLTTKQYETSGLSFMIEAKVLTRVNLDYFGKSEIPATIKTNAGIGLGSSEDELKKAYPNAKMKSNPADPTWHTIVVDAPSGTRGMVFETDGVKIKSLRVGDYPAIAYPNGCD